MTRWTAETKIEYRPHAKAPGSKSHIRASDFGGIWGGGGGGGLGGDESILRFRSTVWLGGGWLVGVGFIYFSPTAESFGVSAQIGSGVVRGDPELRFHQGSTRGSTRVPPGFHQGSTRVLPGFHQGFTRVAPGFHQGSTRVPPGFHQVLKGRGGLGWFEVRFHEGSTRVPPISSRAAGLRKVSRGFRQGSTRVPGCGVVWVV